MTLLLWIRLWKTLMENAPDWQKAGGTMAFGASVHEDRESLKPPSFELSSDQSFREPNGWVHAYFALLTVGTLP